METAVSLRDVVKVFGSFRAVDGVSFDVPGGDIFGILGPNGAGKTTTIRMIMDILRPDEGKIRVLGERLGDGLKDRIGYLPEERGLYRKMKVAEMLEFHGAIKGMSRTEARRAALLWLDRLQLGEWKERKVEELSKGMQQKAQFVAAVLAKPDLLVLDEPFSGMDPVNQSLFKDVILDLNRTGTTILFSTHQMETAEKLCRRIVLIDHGKVVREGVLAEIKAGFGRSSVLLEFDGDGGFLRWLPHVIGVDDYGQSVEVLLEPGADPQKLLVEASSKLRIRRFEVVSPTLHSIFIALVGGGSPHA